MSLALPESKADGQELEREFGNEDVLGDAEPTYGRESCVPVDLVECCIGPVEMFQ